MMMIDQVSASGQWMTPEEADQEEELLMIWRAVGSPHSTAIDVPPIAPVSSMSVFVAFYSPLGEK